MDKDFLQSLEFQRFLFVTPFDGELMIHNTCLRYEPSRLLTIRSDDAFLKLNETAVSES